MPRLVHTTTVLVLGLAVPAAAWAQQPLRQERTVQNSTPPNTGWPGFTDSPQAPLPAVNAPRTAWVFNPATARPEAAMQAAGEAFALTETVAQVGDQYILKGELIGDANLILSMPFAQLEKLPPDQRERYLQELLDFRERLMQSQLLEQAIERKLKYLEFLRSFPAQSDPKKTEELRQRIQSRAAKMFAENLDEMLGKLFAAKPEEYPEISRQSPQLYRLALVMKEANIRSRDDPALDRVLRAHQTTLEKQQQAFMEYAFGQSAIREKVNLQPEITHAQLVAYYREHEAEYHVPTRAQWEQLTVLFQRFANEQAALKAICDMGDQVYLGGAPFWSVAKHKSQEKNAPLGGFHDWTVLGDLKISKPVNDAVFSYPLNELSPVIKDDKGFHIVRVLDRQNAYVKPFTEVQADIKEKIRSEILNKAYAEYVAKIRERTPVITDFEKPEPASRMANPNLPPNGMSR